jgi:hypothetical protein
VTSLDASFILQYVAGLINFFPAEITNVPLPDRPQERNLDVSDPVIVLGDMTAKPGQEILLPLMARGDGTILSGFASLSLPAVCEFVEIVPAAGVQAAGAIHDGALFIAFAATAPVTQDEPVAYLRVRIIGGGTAASTSEVVWNEAVINEGGQATGEGGRITVIGLPRQFALLQNYPNPFNPSTIIPFEIPEAARVQIGVYDLLGRQVAELVNGDFEVGRHVAHWNGANSYGSDVASGIYLVRMKAGRFEEIKKLHLVR